MDLNQVITDLESTAVNVAVQEVLGWLVANVWVGLGSTFLSPIVGWFIGLVISVLMQKLDWLTYMLVENWQTTAEGINYENAATHLSNLPPTATLSELLAARQAKVDAFKKLVGLGSPPVTP
jgi:hypothetical protein